MRGKTRESAGDQVLISFRLASDWFRAWRQFLHQSQTEAKRNQNKSRLLSTINWKLLWPVLYVNILTLTEPNKVTKKFTRGQNNITTEPYNLYLGHLQSRKNQMEDQARRAARLPLRKMILVGWCSPLGKKIIKKAISANTYLGKYGGRTGK